MAVGSAPPPGPDQSPPTVTVVRAQVHTGPVSVTVSAAGAADVDALEAARTAKRNGHVVGSARAPSVVKLCRSGALGGVLGMGARAMWMGLAATSIRPSVA